MRDIKTEEAVKQISLYHIRESMHLGIQETFNSIKNKIYHSKLLETIQIVINQCEHCDQGKYDRNPIKPKFQISEMPTNINQIVHFHIFTIMKNDFLIAIDQFSKFDSAYHLPDKTQITIVDILEEHFAKIGKPSKIVGGNELNAIRIKGFLQSESVSLHITKPHSHTGNAEVEPLHNTITSKVRTLMLEKPRISPKQMLQKAFRNYNERFHSTIKCTRTEVQTQQVNFETVRKNLKYTKEKYLAKLM